MSRGSIQKLPFLALLFFLASSCVKDVDLDQYNEIVIPPTAAIDLIYFNLDPLDFTDSSGNLREAEDFLRLEFLDDDYIQDGLVRADFNFVFTNTFRQGFVATFNFLSESNSLQRAVKINIPPGSESDPAVVDYTEIVPQAEIGAIKRSIKLLVKIEMQSNAAPIEGKLELESKGYYKFEFK